MGKMDDHTYIVKSRRASTQSDTIFLLRSIYPGALIGYDLFSSSGL